MIYGYAWEWLEKASISFGVTDVKLLPRIGDSFSVILYKLARVYSESIPAPGATVSCCDVGSYWKNLRVILECIAYQNGKTASSPMDSSWQLLYKILAAMGGAPRCDDMEWNLFCKISEMPSPEVGTYVITEDGFHILTEDGFKIIVE